MRSFVKIKSSPNGEITLSFTDISKSCPNRNFFTSQICLLTLLAKFPNLQPSHVLAHILKFKMDLNFGIDLDTENLT